MNKSEEISMLSEALSKAQTDIKVAEKDGRNPFFKNPLNPTGSKYATLESIMSATKPFLNKNGLCITQGCEYDEKKGWFLVTTLLHISGEFIRTETPIISKDWTAQGFGSALTYAKRYSWAAITGCGTGDDDDGNEANQNNVENKKEEIKQEKKDAFNKCSQDQIKLVMVLLKQLNISEEDAKIKWEKITGKKSRTEWTDVDARNVIDAMKSSLERIKKDNPQIKNTYQNSSQTDWENFSNE